MKIHREGKGILIKTFTILLIANGILHFEGVQKNVFVLSATLSSVIFLLILNFFRLPYRRFEGDQSGKIIAPADGQVVAIEETFEPEYFKANCIQVSIFMSIFNVHANWFPVQGTITLSKHHNGRFLAAYLPKSSTENERSTVVIQLPDGREILTRQIAGAMARRIVTYAKPGQTVTANDQMGFIKFGSRVDIFMPLDTKILVTPDQKVTATETVIAQLSTI